MTRTASVFIVGDEVLAGEVPDRNGPLLLATLGELGTRVRELSVLPDREEDLVEALARAMPRSDLVLVTGGIGPTHDDITRLAVARALDRPLRPHPEAVARLDRVFRGRATGEEAAMALLPEGSELLIAPDSPGFGFQTGAVLVFPGVPVLLERLLETHRGRLGGHPGVRRVVATRLREGVVAGPLARLAVAHPEVAWGSYPILEPEGWRLELVLRGQEPEAVRRAEAALRAMLAALEPSGSGGDSP